MPRETLPESVWRFLVNYIDSVEQLRVLLLLHANPERPWSIAEITSELRSVESSIAMRLEALYSHKVLLRLPELNGLHKFTPVSPELRETIRELFEQNELRPYRVIDAIYSRPAKALQAFANAFKIRE